MKPRILLVSHSSGIYGAERSLLLLVKGLIGDDQYKILVSCPDQGPLWHELEKLAEEYSIAPEAEEKGMLGWISQGILDEKIDNFVFSLKNIVSCFSLFFQ